MFRAEQPPKYAFLPEWLRKELPFQRWVRFSMAIGFTMVKALQKRKLAPDLVFGFHNMPDYPLGSLLYGQKICRLIIETIFHTKLSAFDNV
jgi:hypothetical protein